MKTEDLERFGYERWNNGDAMFEYWRTIDNQYGFDKALVVRFNQYRDRDFMVYIRAAGSNIPLPSIRHLDQLDKLYHLLKGE